LGLSAGLLAWVISRAGLGKVWADLTSLDGGLYALAGGLFFMGVVLRSLRWQVMLRDFEINTSLGQLLAIYTIGIFFDNLLPTGIGGDIVRALELRRESQRGAQAVSSVLANRLVGIFTMSSLGLVALLTNPGIFPAIVTWSVGGFAVAIVIGVWLVRRDMLTWLSERLPFARPVTDHPKLRDLHATATAYSGGTLLCAVLISVLFTLSLVITQYTIARAIGVELGVKYFAVAAPVIGAVTMLPISFNGLGVREGVYQFLFSSVGVASSAAVAMSLAFYGLRLFVGFLGGALLLTNSARRLAAQKRSQVEG
jgi:uncharacterized membrane protein YbhN (UPF0104 family)